MKNIFMVILLLITPLAAIAQFTPQPVGAYTFDSGAWAPLAASGATGAVTFTPPPYGLYCYNFSTSQWVPWTSANCGGGGGGGTVTSVFTRTGDVTAQALDYNFSQIGSGVIPTGEVLSFASGAFINANELNGTLLSGLATGVLCNTTTTGVPFICAGSNLPLASPPPIGNTTPNTGAFTTLVATGPASFTGSAAASTPTGLFQSTPYAAGSGTTNTPMTYIDGCPGTVVTAFTSTGSVLGVHVCTASTAHLQDWFAGASNVAYMDHLGSFTTTASVTASGSFNTFTSYQYGGTTGYLTFRAVLTMTSATSDVATVTGVTASSKCGALPTDATAAANNSPAAYASTIATNAVTITHPTGAATGHVLVICTTN
jgi:hypothetical protein